MSEIRVFLINGMAAFLPLPACGARLTRGRDLKLAPMRRHQCYHRWLARWVLDPEAGLGHAANKRCNLTAAAAGPSWFETYSRCPWATAILLTMRIGLICGGCGRGRPSRTLMVRSAIVARKGNGRGEAENSSLGTQWSNPCRHRCEAGLLRRLAPRNDDALYREAGITVTVLENFIKRNEISRR